MKLYDGNCYIIDKIVGIYHDSSCSLDEPLKENVLLIGIKMCLISHCPLKHSKTNIDLIEFVKKVRENPQETVYRAFTVTEIAHKGMLIRDNDDVHCIFYDACLEK